jgi:FixJ family two-component response regulator
MIKPLTQQALSNTAVDRAVNAHGIVAVVDDDPHISHAVGMWLLMQGLHTSHYMCAESVLRVIRLQDGRLCLPYGLDSKVSSPLVGAVLDLNLPGTSGAELAHKLRSIDPQLPIVMITAQREFETELIGQLPPNVPCLQKPFDLDDLEYALFNQFV